MTLHLTTVQVQMSI
uniref:Uncharacterized protein n=1 Tax=Arundo donax TaxID=35708 RepID=A0A0A8Y6W5_ARUDO